MDADIWGDDNDDDNKQNEAVDDSKTNPFSSSYKDDNNNNDDDDDDMIMYDDLNNDEVQKPIVNVNGFNHKQSDDTAQNNLLSYFGSRLDADNDVQIVNTEERKGKITKYTVYNIQSSIFGSSTSSVSRRYNDFKWLNMMLGIEFIGVFIPSLPPSNVFERFKDDIISQRRYDLERFLNRINENKILKTSSSFELFLCEQNETAFEEQKKFCKKQINERSDYDVTSLLMRSFQDLDKQTIPEHISGFNKDGDDENEDLYLLDMPRIREFFMRCDERFASLNKICNNLFRIFQNISTELNLFNENLNGLYDAEFEDKPILMQNSCQERYNIRDFMNKWKELEEVQMNSFYKYFLIQLRYEHEDIKAILDCFKRYDIVYGKYKKLKMNLKKQKDKYPDKDYTENEQSLSETKNLLDLLCKIILINQSPKLWNKKIKDYNKAIQSYIDTVTQKPL